MKINLKIFLSSINSIHSCIQFTCNYSKECLQFLDLSVSVDSTGHITTDLYVKLTDTHQYLLATCCHPNHTKPSIPYCQALHILCICSNIETARSHCTELLECLVNPGYDKRKTNILIGRAISYFASPSIVRKSHTTCH